MSSVFRLEVLLLGCFTSSLCPSIYIYSLTSPLCCAHSIGTLVLLIGITGTTADAADYTALWRACAEWTGWVFDGMQLLCTCATPCYGCVMTDSLPSLFIPFIPISFVVVFPSLLCFRSLIPSLGSSLPASVSLSHTHTHTLSFSVGPVSSVLFSRFPRRQVISRAVACAQLQQQQQQQQPCG
jgi:hypothetical protein